ncbi:MAG: cobaltochelatase subunit CobT, partial [Pseudomonadota bacterium]
MANSDASPHELFKNALGVTTKAMSEESELEVAFGTEASHADGQTLRLRTPPREISPFMAATLRGESDAVALRLAHHDPAAHARHLPQGDIPREVYEAAETARIESIGANAMDGTADNLDAALAARCEREGLTRMEDRQDAPLAPAIEFL